MGLGFKVQSLKSPAHLEERVDTFVKSYREKLAGMDNKEFEAQKDALVQRLLEAPKNLGEETSRFWYHIERGYNDFLRSKDAH